MKRLFGGLLFHLCSSVRLAAFGEKEQQCVDDNHIKPQTNLIVVVTVNTALLEQPSEQGKGTVQPVDYSLLADKEIKKEKEANPLQSGAARELYQRLRQILVYRLGYALLAGKSEESMDLYGN